MSLERVVGRSIPVVLCLVLLAALLPAAALAAPGPRAREYIVTLAVTDSDRLIRPSSRSARQRIERRSQRAAAVTRRLASTLEFKTRHRYGNGVTGFSARLTPGQAAELARDATVASVRPARRVRLSSQLTPTGVRRVKAAPSDVSTADVDADVLVIDTGIGPTDGNGDPVPIGPAGSRELNIAGGINCYDDPSTGGVNEADQYPGRWGDAQYHGTHVAGIIGARDNTVGTVGVAPGVRLWSARAWGSGRFSSESNILCALTWAIDTHSDPAQPDIDVINMSFEVPRLDYYEDCGAVLSRPNADPIHKLVCQAHGLGITMVAAAGNNATDANSVAPGGYDQVISVGALTDLDGEGWGRAGSGSCDYYGPADDDTYADFSNRGNEVDVIAPGVCIASTAPSASGDVIRVLSGTSQAAPHVTGAVARWLADAPGTSPERMRKLLRASGRMDWKARSDPRWSGVSDPDDPNRVLDVKALTGPQMLKTWVFHDSFRMGGDDTKRKTRVDVQRGGGYGGAADLDVTGLPASVGSATFDAASLSGLGGLATNMRIRLASGGDDGRFDLGVRVTGPGDSTFSRTLSLTVDRSGPLVTDLAARIRGGFSTLSAKGAVQTYVSWEAEDEVSGVKASWLQRKTGKKPWRKAGTQGASSSRVTLKPGQDNRFRVKASDTIGNRSTSKVLRARLVVRDTTSSRLVEPASGGWKTKNTRRAYGGSLKIARAATDSVTTAFEGKAVAVVGSVGPNRGSFRVRIDGGDWNAVSLNRTKAGHRKVVWSRQVEDGSHLLEIQGFEGNVAIDAVLILR